MAEKILLINATIILSGLTTAFEQQQNPNLANNSAAAKSDGAHQSATVIAANSASTNPNKQR